jgi:hypothetical protein
MLKEVKNIESKNSVRSSVPSKSNSFQESADINQTRKFIGYRHVPKTRIFHAKTEKFFPWRYDAPLDCWLSRIDLSETTRRWRSEFPIYLRASLNFKFYQMNPVELPFTDRVGKRQIYRPLSLLTYWDDDFSPKNRKPLLIDIWSDEDIRSNADFLIPAFRAANRFTQKRKLRFKLFHDSFFLSDYFFNLLFICPYRLHKPEQENRNTIIGIMKEKRVTTLSELIELLPATDEQHLNRLIFDTWVLVVMRELKTDWNKRFNQETVLRIN